MPLLMGQNMEKGRGREADIFIWADKANVWWWKNKLKKSQEQFERVKKAAFVA